MKIAFHGAARTVTGSKHLITLNDGRTILLDCGLFQGMRKDTDTLNRNFGFDAAGVDYMILSHAHIDHCGLLPKLIKDGYCGRVIATPGTRDLAAILMEDSAGIQESDAKFVNKRRLAEGKAPTEILYRREDAKNAIARFEPVDYNTWTSIADGIELCFTDAGHIIGSASVHLKITENGKLIRLTFSGDIGCYGGAILRSPEQFTQADYIILESTYGNSLHSEYDSSLEILHKWINEICIGKKGNLVVPAFSVGRTQEILLSLNQLSLEGRLPACDYIVDSPMSVKATQVLKKYPTYFNADIQKLLKKDAEPFDFSGLRFIESPEQSKQLNYKREPSVIISSSGMADAGRVKHHISHNIENSRNGILMTGYCEPNSLGGRLKRKPKEVDIFGQTHEVNAAIGEMRSMTTHGDYNDLFQFVDNQQASKVKRIFLVHGEYEVQQDFCVKLQKRGFSHIEVPAIHSEFVLD